MALSGTYDFNPSSGEIVLQAFHMCGIRPTALTQEHFQSARMAMNMLLNAWSARGVNLWQVDLQTINLVQGQATYPVLANTVVMLDAYVVQPNSPGNINRIIMPVSRSEYASYSNPSQQGAITTFWFDRLLNPTVTFYQVPDGTVQQVQYYRLRQSQDANYTSGQNVEVPAYWLEALVFTLAQRLAVMWAPERAQGLKALADESYAFATDQNVETSSVYVSPLISGYWRP